jgi:integrase
MRVIHIVSSSCQALAMLRELRPLTGSGHYVFPGLRTPARPMSENTVQRSPAAARVREGEMTGHVFWSVASTLLNEQGWHRDTIERQLAHRERDTVRAAYNYAAHLPECRRMTQAWADYLDSLKTGAEVVPLHGKPA